MILGLSPPLQMPPFQLPPLHMPPLQLPPCHWILGPLAVEHRPPLHLPMPFFNRPEGE